MWHFTRAQFLKILARFCQAAFHRADSTFLNHFSVLVRLKLESWIHTMISVPEISYSVRREGRVFHNSSKTQQDFAKEHFSAQTAPFPIISSFLVWLKKELWTHKIISWPEIPYIKVREGRVLHNSEKSKWSFGKEHFSTDSIFSNHFSELVRLKQEL